MEDSEKIEIRGRLTAGYYNEMEAGDPVFIDDITMDTKIKDALEELGHNPNFCYGHLRQRKALKIFLLVEMLS